MDERMNYGLILYDIFYPVRLTYLHPKTGRTVAINDHAERKRITDSVTGCAYIEVSEHD